MGSAGGMLPAVFGMEHPPGTLDRQRLPADFLRSWERFASRLTEVEWLISVLGSRPQRDEVTILEHWFRLPAPPRRS
jgi:hypothetical protein